MSHLNADKSKLIARVRRIAGQISAVEQSLGEDTDCSAILQQVAAARGAIDGLMNEILGAHLREHVGAPGLSAVARARGVDEVLAALKRYAK